MFLRSVNSVNETWGRGAYLRAGLGEFSSLGSLEGARRFRIGSSRNPLLHLMLLLRNTNIHVRSSEIGLQNTTGYLRLGADTHEISRPVVIITDLTVELLTRQRNARSRYERHELEQIVEWFNQYQQWFGAGEILAIGVEQYCEELSERT